MVTAKEEKAAKAKAEKAPDAAPAAPAKAEETPKEAPAAAPVAQEKPTRLSLADLRKLGAITAERKIAGGGTRVVTKGGRKFTFPGDEEAAAQAGELGLFGIDPAANPAAHRNVTALNKRG